jgi:hypothetical protein
VADGKSVARDLECMWPSASSSFCVAVAWIDQFRGAGLEAVAIIRLFHVAVMLRGPADSQSGPLYIEIPCNMRDMKTACKSTKSLILLVAGEGLEPPTSGL